ncbi:uncharacterized protein B0I36DRAFT_233651 [Microdochium trichocladiopsis]|uniref:Polyprenal reductase n=1 Tax=Microdochium trichocladiopsis TaxID=1682393 RepID=A0A9P9BUL9_9PEZI|nr:uncharacterized protein B0I36DRAFT_233651 [Microdochium trichocladiopsis]KAH7041111.1 hypothetical protein B0I36DRAFT_233651 [Microdochium trichocladiopsis]
MAAYWLQSLTPAAACQLFYVVASLFVLGITIMPDSAKGLLLSYGPRSQQKQRQRQTDQKPIAEQSQNANGDAWFIQLLDWITSIGKVPHSWFAHFYIISVVCSAFWATQFFTNGRILRSAVSQGSFAMTASERGMTMDQVVLTWILMSLQGGRRLYESLFVMRSSSSRMWFVHWALGLAFYFSTSIAVWAEGSRAILHSRHQIADLEMPTFKTVLGTLAFFVAWLSQNRCHVYLSTLKKYSLPDRGLFRFIVSPHYTCECCLYLALAIVAAPAGKPINRTLLCAAMFVAINLGATAAGTKQWYEEKFGADKVRGKWRMIPLVY